MSRSAIHIRCFATIMCLAVKYRAQGVMTITAPAGAACWRSVDFSVARHFTTLFKPSSTAQLFRLRRSALKRLPQQLSLPAGEPRFEADVCARSPRISRVLLMINSFAASTIVAISIAPGDDIIGYAPWRFLPPRHGRSGGRPRPRGLVAGVVRPGRRCSLAMAVLWLVRIADRLDILLRTSTRRKSNRTPA
jgi:hypothetical protein